MREKSFPDHYAFSAAEIRSILAEAEAESLHLVTTEKDFVRVTGLADVRGIERIEALPVRLVLDDAPAVRDFARERLSRRG